MYIWFAVDGAEELRSALDDLIDERIEAHYKEEDEKVAMESNKQVKTFMRTNVKS